MPERCQYPLLLRRLICRNLTPDEFKYYLGLKYNRLKKAQGGTGANQHNLQKGQNGTSATESTAETLAEEHGVSARTVKRAGAAIAKIEEAAPELKEVVQSGKVSVNVAADIADLPEEVQVEVFEDGATQNTGLHSVERWLSPEQVTYPEKFPKIRR